VNIIVNGQNQNISRVNLSMVLEELGYKQMKLATALNGDFISVEQRDNTELKDGDKLEILSPQQGG
jgi:sulfur carrier protein|tara:strand:- start:808 stop:1005 length:198 start_codon:yes stop_codon:yes gene_type:complete